MRRSRSVYTLTIMAQLLHGAAKLTEAEQAARGAIELDPSFPFAWTELALLLDETTRPDEAADCRIEAARLRGET